MQAAYLSRKPNGSLSKMPRPARPGSSLLLHPLVRGTLVVLGAALFVDQQVVNLLPSSTCLVSKMLGFGGGFTRLSCFPTFKQPGPAQSHKMKVLLSRLRSSCSQELSLSMNHYDKMYQQHTPNCLRFRAPILKCLYMDLCSLCSMFPPIFLF